MNAIIYSLYKSSDKNIDKSYECGPKNTVTIESRYTNKFIEEEIPSSYSKFDYLNIDKDVVITHYVNNNGLSNNKN